jgi:hypothetical protein
VSQTPMEIPFVEVERPPVTGPEASQPTAAWLLPETLSAACDPTEGAHAADCDGFARKASRGFCHCACHGPAVLARAEWVSHVQQLRDEVDQLRAALALCPHIAVGGDVER